MRMVDYGVLAVEMEASALYTLAAKHGRQALAVCTVSDHLVTGEETTARSASRPSATMVEVALDALTVPLLTVAARLSSALQLPARSGRSSCSTSSPSRT